MRGLKSEDLVAIVDFLYLGEANVFQESLDSFLAMADEFQLKGLNKNEEEVVQPSPKKASNSQIFQSSRAQNIPIATSRDKLMSQGLKNSVDLISPETETALALDNFYAGNHLDV